MPNVQHILKKAMQVHQGGNLDDAEAIYRRVIGYEPHNFIALVNLANIQIEKQNWQEAEIFLKLALNNNPNQPELMFKLGATLQTQKKFSEATLIYQQILQLKPDYAEVFSNLGVIAKEQDEIETAINYYRQAIAFNPTLCSTLDNLGMALHAVGDFTGAIETYRQALSLHPNVPSIHLNLAMSLLMSGQYDLGWQEYEWRRQGKPVLCGLSVAQQWEGQFDNVSELILVEEQGIGDILQFIRYGKLLKSRIPVVSLAVRSSLAELVASTGLFDKIYITPLNLSIVPKEASWLPIMSLPGILGLTRETPLLTAAYIYPSKDLVERWQKKLQSSKAMKVGLNWQGNPNIEQNNFSGRSLPLSLFSALSPVSGVEFVSLQKGFGAEQLETCLFRDKFVDCQGQISQINDWMNTAAILQSCDLVITTDTSVAHLAGAMGKPVWILLKKIPEWRWGLEGEECSWYPSARLFRQTESGNWIEVMESVKAALVRLTENYQNTQLDF